MSVWLAVKILFGFAVVGALIRVVIDIVRQQRANARMEPENSHPGRLLRPGVPVNHAINKWPGWPRETLDQPACEQGAAAGPPKDDDGPRRLPWDNFFGALPSRDPKEGDWIRLDDMRTGCVTGADDGDLLVVFPGEADACRTPRGRVLEVLAFRPGQWLRRKMDGALVEYMAPSMRRLHSWVLQSDAGRPAPAFGHDEDFEPALPRKDEWWQKTPCPAHSHALVTAVWSEGPVKWLYTVGECAMPRGIADKPYWDAMCANDRDACRCGCLAPVNFGLGRVPGHRSGDHVKVASCRDCGEILAVAREILGGAHLHKDGSSHGARITELALPKAGERWRCDNCERPHQHPGALADLDMTGEYSYDEEGMIFTAKADWTPAFGVGASLECGCLRPVGELEKAWKDEWRRVLEAERERWARARHERETDRIGPQTPKRPEPR